MSRESLIKVINDTLDKCENEYDWMIEDVINIFYDDKFFTDNNKLIKKFSTSANIKLVQQTTVEAIINNKNKVYGVLNFASAKNPGGGVLKGAMAQEEALARASSLYPVIKKCTQFYSGSASSPYYTDKIIYSIPIYVFKDDYGNDIEPIECQVITCAAPNYNMYSLFDKPYGGQINLVEHKKVMTRRFTKVVKSAIANNQRNLILGAWGCGVFKNPADLNAQIFREVLDNFSTYFDEIIFAIPDDANYQIFMKNL